MNSKVKILIIRFSSIGDIVLTTPVIRCLKEQFNGYVEIHYLTKKQYKTVVEHNPNITKIHTIEKSTNEIVDELKALKFDYVIDLHKNLRSRRIIKSLKCISFSFDKLNIEKWLLTNFKINRLPKIHIVDRYFRAVKSFGILNDEKGLDYFIASDDRVDISDLPDTYQNGYVAIAIGGQHEGKKLPKNKLIETCKKIKYPIVLLGGNEDHSVGEAIVNEADGHIFNACGKFSINESASLLEQSNCVVTHDTGLMHIAAAFKKKVVSIWACTSPDFGMYPYLADSSSVVIEPNHLTKRPCSKLGDKCSYGNFKCAKEIDISSIIEAVNKLY